MKVLRIAIIILIMAAFMVSGNAQQANYAGAAKLVLQLTGMGEGQYNARVLYSNDSSIPVGDNCWLFITQPQSDTFCSLTINPSQLTTGTIIGIDDYGFSPGLAEGNNTAYQPDQVDVTVPEGTGWTNEIKILNSFNGIYSQIISPQIASSASKINLMVDPYLNTGNGVYSVYLFANASDAFGNPAADGTVINFTIVPGGSYLNGSLNGNSSQRAYATTSGGMTEVSYGWFPGNKIPTGQAIIAVSLNKTPSVISWLYLEFNGTTGVNAIIVPMANETPAPMVLASNHMPDTLQSPTSTPLSPMITLLSITIGAVLTLAVRRKK